MIPVPFPDEGDAPVHETAAVTLSPSQKATVTMTPETAGNLHYIPTVAASKLADSSYKVVVDGTTRFGPGPIPPTDVDDLDAVFLPALKLNRKLKIEIKDLRDSGGERRYMTQALGWEG